MERAVGMLRTFESLGNCMAYVVGSTDWPNVRQCILSFALWGTCLIPTTLAVWRVPSEKIELSEEEVKEATHTDSSSEDSYCASDEKGQDLLRIPDLEMPPTVGDMIPSIKV